MHAAEVACVARLVLPRYSVVLPCVTVLSASAKQDADKSVASNNALRVLVWLITSILFVMGSGGSSHAVKQIPTGPAEKCSEFESAVVTGKSDRHGSEYLLQGLHFR